LTRNTISLPFFFFFKEMSHPIKDDVNISVYLCVFLIKRLESFHLTMPFVKSTEHDWGSLEKRTEKKTRNCFIKMRDKDQKRTEIDLTEQEDDSFIILVVVSSLTMTTVFPILVFRLEGGGLSSSA
jgi:hypothetical protein